jgi:thiol-disulfide isomerase/thioredoxin
MNIINLNNPPERIPLIAFYSVVLNYFIRLKYRSSKEYMETWLKLQNQKTILTRHRSNFAFNQTSPMKFLTLAMGLLMTLHSAGQINVQKFVLIEHFSNTWCPICAGRNPDFYALVQKYSKNIHQISIHPPYPYSGCPLYQYNKAENQERANYYNIQGTPALVLNGGKHLWR